MYLIRPMPMGALAMFVLMSLLWIAGGWLLARSLFNLRSQVRIVIGMATGWLLFTVLANLASHVLPVDQAFWLASAAVFVAGTLSLWRSRVPLRSLLADFSGWPAVLVLVALTAFFWKIERGLAIFDEYLHLPLISVMAAGDIPPRFYLDPSAHFAYHYGLQIWAANLVRSAGFFPWSAFDLARALAISLTIVLAWVWIGRVIRGHSLTLAAAGLVALAGGTRWLLLLLPHDLLSRISGNITMVGSGESTAPTLLIALTKPWNIQGGGPFPFPFAFHNGVFVPAVTALASDGAMPLATLFLLLLLFDRRSLGLYQGIVASLILASLALSAEHIFAALWLGMALAMLLVRLKARSGQGKTISLGSARGWPVVLTLSGLLGVFQGGFITEAARQLTAHLVGNVAGQTDNFHGFGVRWPPGLETAHFGQLSLSNPSQLIVLLAELGPVLFLAPVATAYAWKHVRRGHWLRGGLGFAALLMIGFALFFTYGVDRSMTRFPASSLWIWLVLALPVLVLVHRRVGRLARGTLIVGACAVAFSGVVELGVQMTAMTSTQYTYYVKTLDTYMSARYWNKLPQGSMVLDIDPVRSVTLFGRPTKAYSGIYTPLPAWSELVDTPDSTTVAAAGYDFVYFDPSWWDRMTSTVRDSYSRPCVHLVDQVTYKNVDFRRLYDVRECRAGNAAPGRP